MEFKFVGPDLGFNFGFKGNFYKQAYAERLCG